MEVVEVSLEEDLAAVEAAASSSAAACQMDLVLDDLEDFRLVKMVLIRRRRASARPAK